MSYRPLSRDSDHRLHSRPNNYRRDDSDSDSDDDSSYAGSSSSRNRRSPTAHTYTAIQLPPPEKHANIESGLDRVISRVRAMHSRRTSSQSYEVVGPDGVDRFSNVQDDNSSSEEGERRSSSRESGSAVLVSKLDAASDGAPATSGEKKGGESVSSGINFNALMDGTPEQIWESVSAAANLDHADHKREKEGDRPAQERSSAQHRPIPPPESIDPHDPAFGYTHADQDGYRYGGPHDYNVHPAFADEQDYGRPASRTEGTDLFKDFDGVHCSPEVRGTSPPTLPEIPGLTGLPRRQSRASQYTLDPLPETRSVRSEPKERDPKLVYYPAPVPAVLNLPPLMAKSKNRQSRANPREAAKDGRRDSNLPNLPPTLRASAFFESHAAPAPTLAPQLQGFSARETLDQILDASALAPPAAFTDHPITGTNPVAHVRNPSANPDYRRSSVAHVLHHPGESPPSSAGSEADHPAVVPDPADPNALPTTLLAELESRKAQQKTRRRTANPTGIHSTLLELDAVAQVEAEHRRRRKTHLAWEEPEANADADPDEDVPLGLLYNKPRPPPPTTRHVHDEDVPLGLLVQKELEDSEPLAARRARLKAQNQRNTIRHSMSASMLRLPGNDDDDEEGETLAQRAKRLREQQAGKRASKFGDGSLELDFLAGQNQDGEQQGTSSKADDEEEETLGARRARLRKEAEQRRLAEEAKIVQQQVRQSIMLQQQQYPMQRQQPVGLVHNAGPQKMLRPLNMAQMGVQMHMPGHRASMMPVPAGGMGGDALNQKQREFVERWRESVL